MLSIKSSADMADALAAPLDPAVRRLLLLRRDQLLNGSEADLGEFEHFIVVRAGETIAARGRIDVALTRLRDGDAADGGQHILTEGYSLALSSSHPLAARENVYVEELANDPMIVRRHCELLPETSRFFTAGGIRPFFSSRTTSDDKALSYVRAGLGITMMPDGFHDQDVARVRLNGFDFTRDIGLVYAAHVDAYALSGGRTVTALLEALESYHDG